MLLKKLIILLITYKKKKIFGKLRMPIRTGMSEMAIAGEIDTMMRRDNASNSFDTIVATGSHSSWPHASLTKRKIKRDDIILVDFGARLSHYCSDYTRVIFRGSPRRRLSKMHDVIRRAQKMAFQLIRPGQVISGIVKKVNAFIEKAGFAKYILHGIGHGIGLEVHEEPRLSLANNSVIKKGMVFTLEPGIYVPRVGGIRIEDVVHVDEDGPAILTR